MSRKPTSTIATIGIDPGKNTMHLIGLDTGGAIVLREKVARDKVVARLANVPPCLIGIEVGMGYALPYSCDMPAGTRRQASTAVLHQAIPAGA